MQWKTNITCCYEYFICFTGLPCMNDETDVAGELCIKSSGEAGDYNTGMAWCRSQGMDVVVPYTEEVFDALMLAVVMNLGKANIYIYIYTFTYLKTYHYNTQLSCFRTAKFLKDYSFYFTLIFSNHR